MFYKKGQIVPNQLIKRKSKVSHLVKFGCDCRVIGKKVFPLSDGNCIEIKKNKITGKKGKPSVYLRAVDCGGCIPSGFTGAAYYLCGVDTMTFQGKYECC